MDRTVVSIREVLRCARHSGQCRPTPYRNATHRTAPHRTAPHLCEGEADENRLQGQGAGCRGYLGGRGQGQGAAARGRRRGRGARHAAR